jgi:hypothetical protein
VVASTLPNQASISPMLVANHAYTVMGLDSAGNIILRNPWGTDGGQVASGTPGDGIITISWAVFKQSMYAFWAV